VLLRRLLLTTLLAAGVAVPARSQAGPTESGYCFSDVGAETVYFGPTVETKLNPSVANDAYPMQREFHAYLKARYGYTSNSNYPVTCTFHASAALAEANRNNLRSQMVQQHKTMVEVDWKYVPDEVAAAASFARTGGDPRRVPAPPTADNGYCVAGVFPGPVYLSATFDAVPPVNISLWSRAWFLMLGAKYGYKTTIDCSNATLTQAQRVLKSWADGAKAGGRQVVETGWKFVAKAPAPAPPVDEDKDPVRNPATAAATNARSAAGKEAPAIPQVRSGG
jgi:hypothetical protein